MTDANFARALHARCVAHAARTALIFDGRSTTYRDLAASVAGCARSLEERGLQPGAAVATVLPNSPAFVATYFAVLHLGGVIVPLGVLLRPREIQSRIALAGAALLVTTPELRGSLEPAAADAGAVVLAMQPDGSDIRPSDVLAPARREPHDVAALAFTSGSTGAPRAAEITHAGLAWNAEALIDAFALGSDDVQLAVPPLSHVLGMTGVMNATLMSGGALCLVERFDPRDALELMQRDGVTGLMGAPPMFVALVRAARKGGSRPGLRFAHGGGAAFPQAVVRDVEAAFGCAVRAGYGMSEVGGGISVTPLAGQPRELSVGRAFPGSQIRVVGLVTRRPLPAGEKGEVQVRSPSVMRGYRGDPDATAAVLDADGWLSTGDIGYLEPDGELFLVDRKKELIIRSGYNVYPREVEEVIFACPGVAEAAVVGVPHPDHGEEVVALVVADDPALESSAVKAFARERLAAYKYPRHVLLVDELPKGPTGKIIKRAIDRENLTRRFGG